MFRWLLNFLGFKKKVVKHIEIDPESVKKHNMIRALANENAELKARIAKKLKEEGEARERKEDLKEEDEVKIELNKQTKELEKKIYPKYFSLKSFFNKLKLKPYKNKLAFYTFDRGDKIAKFGDLGFSSDGDFVLLDDKRRVILKMKNLEDIFQSVGGLGNDVRTYKIPINLDKEGGWIENVMIWKPAQVIRVGDQFRYSKAKKVKFYKYISELNSIIAEKDSRVEELETTITDLQRDVDDLKVSQRIAEDSSETSRVELSGAEQEVSAVRKEFRKIAKELSQVRDTYALASDQVDELERELGKMRKKAESESTKLAYEKALEIIQNIKRGLVKDMPEKEIQIVEKVVENPPK